MHEILVDRWKKKIPSIAVCPTQDLEHDVGYDALVPDFEKALALQFKAYRRRKYKALDYFAINRNQHRTLAKYPKNCAFYVFPDYKTHLQMSQDRHQELLGQHYKILNNTWFVEVHSISSGVKKVSRNDLVWGTIPSSRWRAISTLIESCEVGFRIKMKRDRYVFLSPEEETVEKIEIPSGKFSVFYTKITPIDQ